MAAGLSWDAPGLSDPPARVWRDWALLAVLVPAAVLEGTFRADLPWRALSLAIGVGLVPTLLWRRTRPLLMVAIGFGTGIVASLATTGKPPQLHTMVYLLVLPYALTRWGAGRAIPVGLAIVAVAGVLTVFVDPVSAADGAGGLAVLVASAALGAAFRYRAWARMREFEQVKLVERERLARDLHDTVAHHVSAIAIRAQAGLATAPTRPDAATEALRVIEAEAKRTLTEMRAMVRILRREQPLPANQAVTATAAAEDRPSALWAEDLAPSPGITDLRRLVAENRAGPPVTVRISGDVDEITPPVAAAIYRLAQESVTNARRHARDATGIEVEVAADDSAVRLRVRDDGNTSGARPPSSAGYGLLGMKERVNLLGGTFEAGPNLQPAKGWTVTALLPRAGQGGQP